MDAFHQSTAPAVRRRRAASGRRLLGLLVILALVLLLPGRALADRTSVVLWQPADAGAALTYDAASGDEMPSEPPPADPAADSSDPAPAPSDPAPAPEEPAPAPEEPAPAPEEPAPAPEEPAPAPSEPAPAPSDPAPAPTDPAPPSDEAPAEPAPAPSEPAPSDPAPKDGRATSPKPPASEERQLPATGPAPTSPAPVAPTTAALTTTADASRAPAKPTADADGDRAQTKVVRAAFRRLGLGTIASPAAAVGSHPAASLLAQACTPIGTAAAVDAPQGTTSLANHAVTHPRRAQDEAPMVRGPPAPLQSPSSPIASAASSSAGTGSASGGRDCAILAVQIVFTLADVACATAGDCCDHAAPAPANAAARAPPVV